MLLPCLIVVLFLSSRCATATSSTSDPAHEKTSHDTCPLGFGGDDRAHGGNRDDQYIVRFKSYLLAEDHHERLAVRLPGEGRSWQWVPRYNKAAKHPTDFGLIKINQALGDSEIPTGGSATAGEAAEPCMEPPCTSQGGPLLVSRSVLGMLSDLPFVLDVHPDKQFTGKVSFHIP